MAGPLSSATPEVRAALRKLVRALPESFRTAAEVASTAVVVDSADWDHPGATGPRWTFPHLDAVQRAVVEAEQVTLGYVARDRTATSRVVHPLGLAAKGAAWYLLADTDAGLRTFRVDRLTSVEPTGRPAVRPDGFDLAQAWQRTLDEIDERRAPVRARARARPDVLWLCRKILGKRVRIGPSAPDGRVEMELRGHSARSLAAEIAGIGAAIEVLDAPDVRRHLALIGAELTATYAEDVERDIPPAGAVEGSGGRSPAGPRS